MLIINHFRKIKGETWRFVFSFVSITSSNDWVCFLRLIPWDDSDAVKRSFVWLDVGVLLREDEGEGRRGDPFDDAGDCGWDGCLAVAGLVEDPRGDPLATV